LAFASIPLNLGGRPFGDDLSEIHHEDPVRDVHHQFHIVLDQQDGDSPVHDPAQELSERVGFLYVESGCRLIEEQDLRIGT